MHLTAVTRKPCGGSGFVAALHRHRRKTEGPDAQENGARWNLRGPACHFAVAAERLPCGPAMTGTQPLLRKRAPIVAASYRLHPPWGDRTGIRVCDQETDRSVKGRSALNVLRQSTAKQSDDSQRAGAKQIKGGRLWRGCEPVYSYAGLIQRGSVLEDNGISEFAE